MFTAANAKELALKSWAPDSARFDPKPVPPDPVDLVTRALQRALQPADSIPATAELVRVSKRLDQLNQAMDDDDLDPKQWDMLTRAYDRVFKAWMVLSGTPGSGQRKPAPMRTARTQAYPSPEVLPEPLPASPPIVPSAPRPNAGCGVQAPTSSVPVQPIEPPTPQAQQ